MKDKYRIIQVILILAIFGVIVTYFVSASNSSYSISSSGDFVSSKDNIDYLNVAGFEEHDILGIKYELMKGSDKYNSTVNIDVDILDMDGNILNLDDYPYITVSKSGFFLSDIVLNYNIVDYLDYCNKGGSIDLLNEFRLSFYSYVTPEEGDESNITKNVIDERTVQLVKNGKLVSKTIDAESATIEDFYLTPHYYNGKTVISEMLFTEIDESTNSYYASLDISMGAHESIKNYVFDVTMMSKEFPYRNLLLNSATAFEVEALTGSNYLDIFYNNFIHDPLDSAKLTMSNNKFLVIEAGRFAGNDAVNEVAQYKITFKSFNSKEKITLYLTVNLNFEKKYTYANNTLTHLVSNSTERMISLNSKMDLVFNSNFNAYKLVLENADGEELYLNEMEYTDYLTKANSSARYNISLIKNIVPGFYTLKTYVYNGDIEYDENRMPIAPSDDLLTLATSDTFYIQNADYKLGYTTDGKNFAIDKDTMTLDVYTNDSIGRTVVDFYGIFKDSFEQVLGRDVTLGIYDNLVDMNYLSDDNISVVGHKLYINGLTDIESFYVFVYPVGNKSAIPVKVNVKHIAHKKYVLNFVETELMGSLPTSDVNGNTLYLQPKLLADGKVLDIKEMNYDYKLLNFNETICNSLNISFEKTEDGDYVRYNDLSKGNYLVRCYLVDYPEVYTDLELVIVNSSDDKQDEGELPTGHKYTLKIVNEVTDVAVPNKQGMENRIKIATEVYRDGELTNIVPEFEVIGDTHVSMRNGYMIIKKGAVIGNSVVVTATLKVSNGTVITDSKTFTLVEQNEDNDDNITDEDDPTGPGSGETPGGGNDNPGGGDTPGGGSTDINDDYLIPTSVEVLGFSTDSEGKNYYQLSKATGDKIVLEYICYDAKGKTIKNPAISIQLTWNDATGTTVVKDYPNKEIEITANGIYTNRRVVIDFYANEELIHSETLNIYKATNYICDLKIRQDKFVRGGKIEARASFTNNTLVDTNVLLALICYDKDDKIIQQCITPVVVKANSRYEVANKEDKDNPLTYFSAKIELPYDLEGVRVKAFLLDGTSLEDAKGYYHGTITMTNREGY